MKKFYTRPLALLTFAFSAIAAVAGTHQITRYVPVDRSAWTITGCSQRGTAGDSDGGFAQMIDDNVNTYWHTQWSSDKSEWGHFFVIDRGENAPEFKSFGYTPRAGQTQANGYVTDYRLYVTDENPNLSVCASDQLNGYEAASHSSLAAWAEGKTPAATGTFDYVFSEPAGHVETIVDLPEASSGRYVIFVVDGASCSQGAQCHAHCAEFNLYSGTETVTVETVDSPAELVGRKFVMKNRQHDYYLGVKYQSKDNSYQADNAAPGYKLGNVAYGIDAVWTVTEKDGEYLFRNEITGLYAGSLPGANNMRLHAVEADEAVTWAITAIGDYYFVHTGDNPDDAGAIDSWHMVDWDGIVRWMRTSDASQFKFDFIPDEDFAKWADRAIADARAERTGKIGYKSMTEAVTSAIAALEADNTSIEAFKALADALAADDPYTLPQAGKYYAITGAAEGWTNKYLTESYTAEQPAEGCNRAHVIAAAENVVPALWQFTPCADADADLFTITAANSGSALRYTRFGEVLRVVAPESDQAGKFDILNPNCRTDGGVSLVNYLDANRSDRATARILDNGDVDSHNGDAKGWTITEVTEVAVILNAVGVAAVNFPFAVAIPEGVRAYTIGAITEKGAVLTAAGSTVAAGTPVILRGNGDESVNLTIVTEPAAEPAPEADEEAILKGTLLPAEVENAMVIDGLYLTKATGAIAANSAYVVLPEQEDDIELLFPAESISLSDETLELTAGETATLTATVLPADAAADAIVWTSSDEAVATVDAEGKVTAVAAGTAVITAACGDLTATCAVTVNAKSVAAESITLSDETLSLTAGETATLTATVLPADADNVTVVWTSSNEEVATVDAEGKVTAVAAGSAVITAACGDLTATCAVTVAAGEVDSINSVAAAAAGELYDFNGRRVKTPANGVYLMRRGSKVTKVIL